MSVDGYNSNTAHRDDPLYVDDLKPALYHSAAAETVNQKLSETQQPWPRGMEILQDIVSRHPKGHSTMSNLWEAQVKRTEYAQRMLQAWAATKATTGTGREMDALLMPCSPWPACEKYRFSYDNYTSLWNVLDYCATTVPVTKVTAVDIPKPHYDCRNIVEAKIRSDYSPEHLLDAPVAIQLLGLKRLKARLKPLSPSSFSTCSSVPYICLNAPVTISRNRVYPSAIFRVSVTRLHFATVSSSGSTDRYGSRETAGNGMMHAG